jgi:hypothetical protein
MPDARARLAHEIRRLLHANLDTVLDASDADGHRVIDELVAGAQAGHVFTVSVHAAETTAVSEQPPSPN